MMDKDTYLGEDGRWYIKNTEQQPPHRSSGVGSLICILTTILLILVTSLFFNYT